MDDTRISEDKGVDPLLALEQEPPLGTHLTTTRRGYCHHGIYVGKGRVVHYSGLSGAFWQCGPVEEVSLSRLPLVAQSASSNTPSRRIRPKGSSDAPGRASGRTIIAC
jgi:hypothetical protein